VILALAIPAGLVAGLIWAKINYSRYQPPDLRNIWLVFIAFLPQFLLLYLPDTIGNISDPLIAILLTTSQIILLVFVWLNRKLPGMVILLIGAALNLTVMTSNRGFMPISPETASRLVSQDALEQIPVYSRFGTKDILLHPEQTRLEWLSDRFLPPAWFSYQVAFSLGDIFLALGVFWLLASQKTTTSLLHTERITS